MGLLFLSVKGGGNLFHGLGVAIFQVVPKEPHLEFPGMAVGEFIVGGQQDVQGAGGAFCGGTHVHDEDAAAPHAAVLLMDEGIEDAHQGLHGDGSVVLGAAAAVDDVGEACVQDGMDAGFAHGQGGGAQETGEGGASVFQAHVPQNGEQLRIGGAHVLGVFFRGFHGKEMVVFVPSDHGGVVVGMAADLIAVGGDGAEQVRVVEHVAGDDEEGGVDLVLPENVEELVDGVVLPPVVEGQEDGVVADILTDGKQRKAE